MTAPIEVNQTKLQRTLRSQHAMDGARDGDTGGGGTAAERGIRAASLDMEYGDLDLDNGDDGMHPLRPLTHIRFSSPSHTHTHTCSSARSHTPPRPHASRFTLHTPHSLPSGLD